MVTLLAADEAEASAVTARLVVAERDLQRRVAGFGARVREEYMAERFRSDVRQSRRELERARMVRLETDRVIELVELSLHGLDDLRMAMPRIAAPQPRQRVEDLAAVVCRVVHTLCSDDDPRGAA